MRGSGPKPGIYLPMTQSSSSNSHDDEMMTPSSSPISIARSRCCTTITRCKTMATLFARSVRPVQCRQIVEGRFVRRAYQQLAASTSTTSSITSSFLPSSSYVTALRKFTSAPSSIETRKDALTSSDGVVGYPIDFDTASTIEGKESQVRRKCVSPSQPIDYKCSYMYNCCIDIDCHHTLRKRPSVTS